MPLKPPNVVQNLAFMYNPVGNHQQTSATAAVTLSPPSNAFAVRIQNSGTADARYVIGGTVVPTTTKGFVLVADEEPIIIPVNDDTNIVVIEESSGAVIEYQWLGLDR